MTPEQWIAVIAALVSIGSAAGTIYTAWSTHGKDKADAASTLTGAALNMVNELQEQLKAAQAELSTLRQRQHEQSVLITSLQDRIRHLEKENERLKTKNAHLRTQFEIATGTKPDTNPLKGKGTNE